MHRSAIAICLLLAAAIPALSAPEKSGQGNSPVQVVSDSYDFGARSELDISPITHTFVLDAGSSAVTVDRLQPSCHCTHAVADRETDSYGRFKIPAGQSVDIAATVDQADLAPGDVEKDIYVFVNGESTPAVTLHISGKITPAVSFSPTALDFGHIACGAVLIKTVAVTIDRRLMISGKLAELHCASPAIAITKSGDPISIPGGYLRQTFQVTVSAPKAPGTLAESLVLKVPNSAYQNNMPWSIPVTGIVTATSNVKESSH